MKSRWKQYLLYASVIIIGGGLLFILVETVKAKNTGFETKTLWDWMELLIIPLVLAGGAIVINWSESKIERQRAEDRAKLEREIATDRQQEAALQAYLDRMADLLLKDKLRKFKNEEVRDVARIRTLTVLRGLDGYRKRLILLFLKESGLIGQRPIIDLTGADFSSVWLSEDNLSGVNLSRAELSDAYMYLTVLSNAVLSGANLSGANLSDADLSQTNLSRVLLTAADLTNAFLTKANLTDADLTEAILTNADLTGANLRGAHLGGFLPSTDKQLLATVKSLKGATMPDGTIHD